MIALVISQWTYAQKPEAIRYYNGGLEYYNLHNYEVAIPFFEDAIKEDNTFVNAYRTLISCHEQLNNFEKSAKLYEKVIELSPSDKTLAYNLALTYIDLKNYEQAVVYLKKALAIDMAYTKASNTLKEVEAYLEKERNKNNPTNTSTATTTDPKSLENSIYHSALLEYKEERYNDCLNKLNEYKDEVTNPDFYYLQAIALQHLGDRAKAIKAYEQTLKLNKQHFDANLNLGKIYYNDNKFKEAVALLELAYTQRKNDMKLLHALAKAHFFANEFKEAVPYFQQCLERNSKEGESWRLLGECYDKLGKNKDAAAAFEEAKKYSGKSEDLDKHLEDHAAIYGREASEYTKEGNYDKAIAILEKAIAEHSEVASLHFNLGLNYMEVGNTIKAREEFKKTIDLEPSHAKAYQGLGQIYYEKGDFKEAAAYYMATIDAGKHDEFVYYKLGSCDFKLQRFQDAVKYYQEAINLNNKEKRYHFGIGLAYLGLDENNKSIDAMLEALKLDNMYLDAQYHICVNYIKTNRFKECIAEAEKIIEKDSNYAKAYLVIGHAHKRLGNYVLAEEFQKKAERLDPTLKQ